MVSASAFLVCERAKRYSLCVRTETMTTVTVSADRLKALEELEATLPSLLAKAKEEAVAEMKKASLAKLREKQKADPKAHSDSVLKKYHENKEEINARRRAAYQAKKAAGQPPA
jgi:hypothetical protein